MSSKVDLMISVYLGLGLPIERVYATSYIRDQSIATLAYVPVS